LTLALAIWYGRRFAWPDWIRLAVIGLLAHGMVDNPLAWLGPVVMFWGISSTGSRRDAAAPSIQTIYPEASSHS